MEEYENQPLGVEGQAPNVEWVEATPIKPHVKEINVWTSYAIRLYLKLARTQRRAEEIEAELNAVMTKIPKEDREEYIRVTDEIQAKEDKKLDDYIRRLRR